MKKFGKLAVVALAISALVLGVYGCKKAEDAGKDAETSVEEAKEKVEEAGKTLEKSAEDVKDIMK
ncbi:MAG: hypothetical protein JW807_15355 [Spirochaetes bacterium]|nr:hypothetical protein [Spirochaetota bacterium]